MSFFGSIVDKIVHFATTELAPSASAAPTTAAGIPSGDTGQSAPVAAVPAAAPDAAAPAASLQSVDVGAVLAALDAKKGGGLNYQTSIVDLLKLLDLDSSLAARKTLAGELGVHAGEDGTAEQNVALHKAVVQKLAENGGTVPASMQG
jgi:3-oxoacyl-ACP reductase-like protein